MSNAIENIEAPKRRRGRPRKNAVTSSVQESEAETLTTSPAADAATTETDDSEILDLDKGDIVALESWNPASGKPFARRGDLQSSISYLPDLNPPGTLVFRPDPTKQYQRSWLEEDGSRHARQMALVMRNKGWSAARAEEFAVCEELREFLISDDSGRLVYADLNGKTAAVVMIRSHADYKKDRKEQLRHSDDIQLSAEEKAARLQENLRRSGMSGVRASATLTDDLQD